jgi:hypothetical protein
MECVYISLGRRCDVAHNIKKFNLNNNKFKKTNFFDWLRCDFKCMLEILKLKQPNILLNKNNIVIDKELFRVDSNVSITFDNFDKQNLTCLSHHDINLHNFEINPKRELTLFIKKYKRRFYRFLDLIKSNNRLVFIYHYTGEMPMLNENEGFYEFKKIILEINKDCNYYFVFIANDLHDKNDYAIMKCNNFIKINKSYYTDTNIEPTWECHETNWNYIFNILKKLII